MAYPSHVARSALRRALREHPQAATVLNGRLVNSLTLPDLNQCLVSLGLDPGVIAFGTGAPPAPHQLVELPCDNPPQVVET